MMESMVDPVTVNELWETCQQIEDNEGPWGWWGLLPTYSLSAPKHIKKKNIPCLIKYRGNTITSLDMQARHNMEHDRKPFEANSF